MATPTFDVELLLKILETLPDSDCYYVAYSGGMDSCLLLQALASLQNKLSQRLIAIHINHGISDNSSDWVKHCNNICQALGVECRILAIKERCPKGESLEAWARHHRYKLLKENIGKDDILLTAHHKDDQAETLLLQLFRGAGPKGLSAMPEIRRFGAGWLARPLLQFSRCQLEEYARVNNLNWIDDESNCDLSYDRNYLRHKIIPVINKRWVNLNDTLSRAASHQVEAVILQDELALIDIQSCSLENNNSLAVFKIIKLSQTRQKNVVRYWLRALQLPVPDAKILNHILMDVIQSKRDSVPCVSWPGAEIRRYRNTLFAIKPLPKHDSHQTIQWMLEKPCPIIHGSLIAESSKGNGISKEAIINNNIEIRYRLGGERIKPAGHKHARELKKLFQENGVVPWFRDRIPLLFINGQLAAVPGLWIEEKFNAGEKEACWQITWTGLDEVISGL